MQVTKCDRCQLEYGSYVYNAFEHPSGHYSVDLCVQCYEHYRKIITAFLKEGH